MGNIAISVENLGKRYRIGQAEQRPQNLREALSAYAGSPFRYLRSRLREPGEDEMIWALKDVSFEVKHGEVLGIIGRNGAGKSTLLKILSRITEPTEGWAKVYGRVGSLLEVGTGFHPELTGRENIYLNGSILGMRRTEVDRKFDEIVDFSGVEKFLDTPVKRYSSGMYVRLAFAVAAHLEPEILLVDEVLAVGDVEFQKKCLGKMGSVAKEGRTVLFVSHNTVAISMLCSKALYLQDGRTQQFGNTQEVLDAYLGEANIHHSLQTQEFSYDDAPDNPAQITRVHLSKTTTTQFSLRYDLLQPIHVEIEFVIRHYFSNLFVACSVFNLMNQLLYSTNEMDWMNYTGSEKKGEFPKEAGQYIASVILPAPLLQPGIYELWLSLSHPTDGGIDVKKGIYLEILDNHGSFMSFPFKRVGMLAIALQWQVNRISSVEL